MANRRLTKTSVDAIEALVGKDSFVWDTELRGFGVRTSPKGVKSFVLQYRMKGKPARRMTIGGFGNPWTVETARREAERRLIKIRQGLDPVEEERLRIEEEARREEEEAQRIADEARRRADAETFAFGTYAETFVDVYLKANWQDSWKTAEGILNAAKPHFDKSIRDITRADVVQHLDRYNDRPGMKKLVHSTLRKLFNWAEDRGDIERSPIDRMKAPKAVAARRRILSPEEVIAVWHAAAELGSLWRPYIRLLLCTMARREEVANMDWAEVDLDAAMWQLPAERAKNDQPHRIPLNVLALSELESLAVARKGFVFTTTGKTGISGFSKMKKALDEKMLGLLRDRAAKRGEKPESVELPQWRLHDLRRTGTTNLQALGVPVEVTEAILNHISGTTAGVAGVYNLYRYDPEKRSALDKWSKQLTILVRNADSPLTATGVRRSGRASK
ncbi:integrase [Sphingomonas leidyi]|uniref:Integrase n=1 Tax=Sphingomonas leidyi TaxID=68569 RepID=A0A7X5UXZ8_9SPHN|nr:site-specific integrase [Sphingomonas leidyi]NIJ64251.1 integrase [Sphingomonas leidyi]